MQLQLFDILTLLAIAISFGISPGPGTLAVLLISIREGLKPALFTACGEVCGDLLYLILALGAVDLLSGNNLQIVAIMALLGATYIIFIGAKGFNQAQWDDYNPQHQAKSKFVTGFFISISNPKVIVFYLSLLPSILNWQPQQQAGQITDYILICLVFIPGVFIGVATIACFGRKISTYIKTPKARLLVNRISSSLLIAIGLFIIYRMSSIFIT